jgi:hypothetical protein
VSGQNFTLGQEGLHFVLRLRTLIAGSIGRPVVLKTAVGSLVAKTTVHVVATYSQGVERFYINGMQQPGMIDVRKDVLIGFGTGTNPIAQIAYSFFFFFPVSLFLSIFLSLRSSSFYGGVLTSATVGAGLLAITEIFQAFSFDRAIDFPLMGCGVIIAAIASLIGANFSYCSKAVLLAQGPDLLA